MAAPNSAPGTFLPVQDSAHADALIPERTIHFYLDSAGTLHARARLNGVYYNASNLGVLAITEGDNAGLRRIHAADNGTSLGGYIDLDDAESATIGGTATVTGGSSATGRGGAGVFEGGVGDEGGPVSVVAGASTGDNDGPQAVLEGGSAAVTGNFGGTSLVRGGNGGAAGTTGGEATLRGGDSQGSGAYAEIIAEGKPSDATHGYAVVKSNNSTGAAGQALISNGAGKVIWGGMGTDVARTATADGLTTGIIAAAGRFQFVTVTSGDAAHIIVLPTPTPGVEIILHNGATAYELKSSAPATVAINGGTGAAVSSTIAANSTVRALCVSATAWKAIFLDADSDVAKVEAAH